MSESHPYPVPQRAQPPTLRVVPAQGLDLRQPFTRAIGIESGITDRQLRTAAFRQVFWGVHVSARVPITPALRARAALLVAPAGSVLSHENAARLWGGVVPESATVHVTIPWDTRFSRAGIRPHVGDVQHDVGHRHGIRVTSAVRTFADLTATLGLLDLVVLGDSLVKAGQVTPEQLVNACRLLHGRNATVARRAARLVRHGVASPMETRLRLLIVLAGLPEPEIDHQLSDADGRLRYRLDLAYVKAQLAIEYDGAHHDLAGQRGPDLVRREDLEGEGWTFNVVVASHLLGDPARVLTRLVATMNRCGMTVSPLRDEWRRHIPTRPG